MNVNGSNQYLKKAVNLIDFFILAISYLIPRRKTLWAFGNSSGYTDNAKYLYEEVALNHPEIDSVWMASKHEVQNLRSMGIRAYNRKSFIGLWIALRAKVYLYSSYTFDISFPVSGGAFKVNLWHGAPIKEIEFLISGGPLKKAFDGSLKSKFLYPYYYQKPDILLTLGVKNSEIMRKAFRVDESNCVSNIYPRCKIFLANKDNQLSYIMKSGGVALEIYYKSQNYERTYIYMPTFRDAHPRFLQEAGFNFDKLNDTLRMANAFFVLKVHTSTLSYLSDIKDYSNIYIVRDSMDAYPLLPFIDVLITDYSSIYFDALYLRREILLFPFDQERYSKEDRPFVIDYNNEVKGKRVTEFNELLSMIKDSVDCHLSDNDYKYMLKMYASNNNSDFTEIIKQYIGL